LILAQPWFGISSWAIVAVIVFLIGLLPIIAAFRVIANRRHMLVFICSWLLPLPLLFILLFGNQFLFGANGDEIQGISIFGIALIVFITDLIASVLLIMLVPRYLHPPKEL
jgi:hypothetical protein